MLACLETLFLFRLCEYMPLNAPPFVSPPKTPSRGITSKYAKRTLWIQHGDNLRCMLCIFIAKISKQTLIILLSRNYSQFWGWETCGFIGKPSLMIVIKSFTKIFCLHRLSTFWKIVQFKLLRNWSDFQMRELTRQTIYTQAVDETTNFLMTNHDLFSLIIQRPNNDETDVPGC